MDDLQIMKDLMKVNAAEIISNKIDISLNIMDISCEDFEKYKKYNILFGSSNSRTRFISSIYGFKN